MKKLQKTLITLLFLLFVTSLTAQSLIIRPETSIGYMPLFGSNGTHAVVQHHGGKVLMALNDKMRFGLKADYVIADFKNPIHNRTYCSTGVVLEMVIAKYFNMGIGTVGYVLLDNKIFKESHPFSVYTHLGFEYAFKSGLMILAAYQADFMFMRNFGLNNAFKLGVGYKINFKGKRAH